MAQTIKEFGHPCAIQFRTNVFDSQFRMTFFLVKTSLGALSTNFGGIELDRHIMLGSVMLVWVKSARITAIWIGDHYMR